VKALLRRVGIWRVGLAGMWLPSVAGGCRAGGLCIHSLITGMPLAINSGTPISLLVIIALLVVGEELGWRGFALPHLQARYNGLVASLILGVLWAGWHLANATIPGLQYYLYGFPAFLFFVVAQTVLFTWLFNHTYGSVLFAWIFHAWINISNSLFFVGDQITQWWLVGAGSPPLQPVLLVEGPNLARNASATYRESPRATFNLDRSYCANERITHTSRRVLSDSHQGHLATHWAEWFDGMTIRIWIPAKP
jgi:membrane protease YdiL (CAAX protease family)